jgi:hypothetical protein
VAGGVRVAGAVGMKGTRRELARAEAEAAWDLSPCGS